MSFGLNTLKPIKEPFALDDDTDIYFKARYEFSHEEYAEYRRLIDSISNYDDKIEKAKTDVARENSVKKQLSVYRELVSLLLPDMPREYLVDGDSTLAILQLDSIVMYWMKVNKEHKDTAEKKAE